MTSSLCMQHDLGQACHRIGPRLFSARAFGWCYNRPVVTPMAAMSNEERLVRLETRQETLATKEDIANLEARLIKWMVGLMLGSIVAATAIATLIERLT